MQIYTIYIEIHQWEYTWRLTKYDFHQTMRISGLYAKHLNLYMTGRIIIHRHRFIKVKR